MIRTLLPLAVALFFLVGCALTPSARTDCAAAYSPGTLEYDTCYGNIDRQQTELVDTIEWGEAEDAAGPLGGGALVPPP